jgi:hypothetical protein
MSIHFPQREPRISEADIEVIASRVARKVARETVDMRLETLKNLVEPAPEPAIPGLLRFAVDAFDAASLGAAMVGAFALTIAKSVIR